MADFAGSMATAQEASQKRNPFGVILDSWNKAQSRRYEEDAARKKEEAELKNALISLGAKAEYEKAMDEEEEKGKRETTRIEQEAKASRQRELLGAFGMGGKGKAEDIELTGGSITAEGEPTFTFGKTAAAKGKEASVKEGFERAEAIRRAAKKLASITRQFNEALPQEQKDDFTLPFRVAGTTAGLASRFGLKSNPKLTALQDTAKLQLRSILRDMGEGARMSDQDITQNVAVIEQAGLSDKERKAKVSSFMQTAIDSMDKDTIRLITEDDSSVKLLKSFGVKLQQQAQGNIPSFRSEQEAEASGIKGEVIINGRNARID